MKKTILAVLLMGLAGYANADYSSATRMGSICQDIGKLSLMSYENKQAGRERKDIGDLANTNVGVIIKFAVDFGYDKATGSKDAYMTSWANCMDNFEEADLRDKYDERHK